MTLDYTFSIKETSYISKPLYMFPSKVAVTCKTGNAITIQHTMHGLNNLHVFCNNDCYEMNCSGYQG